jgi:hypothetical protein
MSEAHIVLLIMALVIGVALGLLLAGLFIIFFDRGKP